MSYNTLDPIGLKDAIVKVRTTAQSLKLKTTWGWEQHEYQEMLINLKLLRLYVDVALVHIIDEKGGDNE